MTTSLLSLALYCFLAPPVETSVEAETLLYVSTTPAGAEVVLDGNETLGESNGLFRVPEGVHEIVIKIGKRTLDSRKVEIRAGRVTRVTFDLIQQPGSTPSPKSVAEHSVWTCSMHPQIRLPGLGRCPICARTLIPVTSEADGAPQRGEGAAAGESTRIEPRRRHFVRLVIGNDIMTFEGHETTLDELQKLMSIVRISQVVLEVGTAREGVNDERWERVFMHAAATAALLGYEYTRDIGPQTLRSLGSPAEMNPATKRHFVRIVIGKDRLSFEGRDTTWEELPELLSEVPDRGQTVLEMGIVGGGSWP